ncbi:hypothetical protein QEV83_14840 [Methylocapsa sp. D3K7]|uniref:hypothetical protein n=1 Tax=Methylocapsa sp. D3K7 TaxID=3041435 RepID=UPI00244E74AD|nr:hypothetical protein [Methylocapsa sp. D3K7]WGJ13932.1 hypothetical protein QEV83_14840 [Methylocapsa sp. D3K7]
MNTCLKSVAFVCVVSIVSIGTGFAKMTRMAALEECMAKAHKEAPVSGGNDVNTSANSKAIVHIYSSCMVDKGFRP